MSMSQVAQTTRMKVQIVEAIEREDFGKMAAPIYGKGFIKLYAELMGLDPKPLFEEYLQRLSSAKTPSLVSEGQGRPRPGTTAGDGTKAMAPDESHVRVVGGKADAPEPPSGGPGPVPAKKPRQRNQPVAIEELELFAQARNRDTQPPAPAERLPAPVPPAQPVVTVPSPEAAGTKTPPVAPKAQATAAPRPTPSEPVTESLPPHAGASDWFRRLDAQLSSLAIWRSPVKAASVVVGIVLILLLMISTLSRCTGQRGKVDNARRPPELQVVVQPPEPYFN
jgi:hypothetical protein